MRSASKTVFDRFIGAATVKPGLRRAVITWMCKRNIERIADHRLRAALTPTDEPMCRRLVVAHGFYDSLQRDNVDLITERIERVEAKGIRTTDGQLHELDVLVLATGFEAHKFMRPMRLTGRDGRTIDEEWEGGAKAYKTVAIPEFPNFFMLLGPYSPFGNQSQMTVAETQIGYIVHWLRERQRGGWKAATPTREATDQFNAAIKSELSVPGTIWTTGCANAWYQGADGQPELWPWRARKHAQMLEAPDTNEWTVIA